MLPPAKAADKISQTTVRPFVKPAQVLWDMESKWLEINVLK